MRDEQVAARVRVILEEALCGDEEIQREVDRAASPRPGLRESIIGSDSLAWSLPMMALLGAAVNAMILAWLGGWIFDLSPLARERVFWTALSISAVFQTAGFMRNAIGELSIEWARVAETAGRNLQSLQQVLQDLNMELKGSVPSLERYSDHDLWGPSPNVDAALKGVRLRDRSRPTIERCRPTHLRSEPLLRRRDGKRS